MTRIALPPSPLVSSEWLATHLADVRVVDIRGKVLPVDQKPRYLAKRADYDAAHIPGARFVDWTKDIVDLEAPVHAQLARPDGFARAMQAIGVGDDTAVVVYDDYSSMFAGRFAWALRYYGHDDVRILDGGFQRWASEGRAVTSAVTSTETDEGAAPAGRFTPRARPELYRTADQVAAASAAGALLIDARPPAQYAGETSAASRKGHIPGARNVHYAKLIDPETALFRAKDEMARVFAEAGVDTTRLPKEVIVYCNGGVSATVPLTALALLGRTDVAVYDGSWNEWGNDPQRPIE